MVGLRTVSAIALLFAAAALGACDACDSHEVGADAAERADEVAEELYTTYCAFCHGDDGEGYLADNAPALSNQTFLSAATDEFLRSAIVHGRPGTPMSAWGEERAGPLTNADVDLIIAYIRDWQEVPMRQLVDPPEGRAARGRGAYRVHCASCHGDEGEGGLGPALANPVLLASASDAYLADAIRSGRPGTPMLGFEDQLPERTVGDLVALMRSWERDVDAPDAEPFEPDWANAVIHPDGPEPEFTLREDRFVGVDAVNAALERGERLAILDARATADFLHSHIERATSAPFYDVEKFIETLDRSAWMITYCGCPHAVSGQLADALRNAGFARVAVLDEGFYEWERRGYPVVASAAAASAASGAPTNEGSADQAGTADGSGAVGETGPPRRSGVRSPVAEDQPSGDRIE